MNNEQRKSTVAGRIPLLRRGPSEWRSWAEVGVRLDKMSYEQLKPKLLKNRQQKNELL